MLQTISECLLFALALAAGTAEEVEAKEPKAIAVALVLWSIVQPMAMSLGRSEEVSFMNFVVLET